MRKSIVVLIVLFTFLLTGDVFGRDLDPSWLDYENGRLGMNGMGMGLLIIWASVNILIGVAGWIFSRGTYRYFFQMNAFWNLFNLGLGLAGYLGASGADLSLLTQADIVAAYHDMQNLYILNAGLDVAYIAIAFFLIERARRIPKWRDLLKGYGYSLILQGGFLFVFDLVMFLVHRSHATLHLYPLLG